MAMSELGSVVGSVSGGCIEDDLVYRYAKLRDQGAADSRSISSQPPERVRYGVTADEAHRFGLPCGGTLELLLEFNPDPKSLGELVSRLESGGLTRRITDLTTGVVRLEVADAVEELFFDDVRLVNTFGPEYRMLIIGAGQIAEYLATMAQFSGFMVSVCDPRKEYTASWSVQGSTLCHDWPDDCVRQFKPDRRTCVLALSHDPKLDDSALIEALGSNAFYVGAIGSRANHQGRRVRLRKHFDIPETLLARLRGPIGIFIGSKTPAEIAVSVMAEVLAVKNNVPLPRDFNVAVAKSTHALPIT
jgi:xanthine dehydrogenase accessory factor